MNKGTCFYEGVLNDKSAYHHMDFLLQHHFAHLEFTVHPKLMALEQIQVHIQNWIHHKGTLSFHMPSFIENDLSLPSTRISDQQITHQLRYFDWLLESCKDYAHPLDLVYHGAESDMESSRALLDVSFHNLDRLMNATAKRDLPIRFLIENTCPRDVNSGIFDKESLTALISNFNSPQFGLCFDIAHWWRSHAHEEERHFILSPKSDSLQSKIIHFHLHGFGTDFKRSHLSIKHTPKEFLEFVKAISSKNPNKILGLEIFEFKGDENLSTYENELLQWFQ